MTLSLLVAGMIGLSYLAGSVPFAYIYGRLRGVDIRTQGSGNPGATNVMRIFGVLPGVLVLLADAAKGYLAVAVFAGWVPLDNPDWLRLACGVAAILGHTYTLFLGFKGGKGVATTCGAFLALAPFSTLLVLIPFVGTVALTRYISAGSILAAASFPFIIWFAGEGGQQHLVFYIAILIAAMIIMKHRSNIGRILNGTENKFGQKAELKTNPTQRKDA